jgi:hypothetical protein
MFDLEGGRAALGVGATTAGHGSQGGTYSSKFASSPTPGEPVVVGVNVRVNSIQTIDPKTSTTSIIFFVCYTWIDPRVAEACREDPDFQLPDDLWKPGLGIANGIDETNYTVDSVPLVWITGRIKGKVVQNIVFSGTIDNPMSLENFPFDEDTIDIRLVGSRMRNGRGASASDFILRAQEGPTFVTCSFNSHLLEFQLLGLSYVEYIAPWQSLDLSYITFGIHIRRKHWYYFYKVTVLMWLIVLLSLPTFLFGFEELEQRMALTATMFLATAATLYVVAQDLPKTEQLHKMDKLLLGTLGIIFATGAESIAVFLLHKTNVAAATKLEDLVSVSLPAAYFLLNVSLFG